MIEAAGELKTKPTQHSVNELRRIGIAPDVVVCRSAQPLSRELRVKIALFADLDTEAVVAAQDVEHLLRPAGAARAGLRRLRAARLGIEAQPPDLEEWSALGRPRRRAARAGADRRRRQVRAAAGRLQVGHRGAAPRRHPPRRTRIDLDCVDAEALRRARSRPPLQAHGDAIPGGFGIRGIEGKIMAAQFAREQSVPFLGVCLGMQVAVIEYARHMCGMDGRQLDRVRPETPYPVVDLLPEQKELVDKGGTMRLGAEPVQLRAGHARPARPTAGRDPRAPPPPLRGQQRAPAAARGGRARGLAARSPDGDLVEVIELPDHPFFVARQFHPEFKSRPTRPPPLFREFVGAAVDARSSPVPAAPPPRPRRMTTTGPARRRASGSSSSSPRSSRRRAASARRPTAARP